jgi:hypothetical protein
MTLQPLNSPLEVAVRVLALLVEYHPGGKNIDELVQLDHTLVHSGDFRGPESLHPDVPTRTSELGLKRQLVNDALTLILRVQLAEVSTSSAGLIFRSSESGPGFLALLRSSHAIAIRERARWLATQGSYGADASIQLRRVVTAAQEQAGQTTGDGQHDSLEGEGL